MIGSTLQRILDEKGFNVNELSKRSGVSAQTLYSIIKRDNMKVDIDVLIKICRVLNVPIDLFYRDYIDDADFQKSLNKDEMQHIEKYRTLDEYGKKAVRIILDYEAERKAQSQAELHEKIAPYGPGKALALYELPVSAGTGTLLQDEQFELIDIPATGPLAKASFALRVSGDSMQPNFYDGDIVAVQKTSAVEPGEIGIFVVNGGGYMKRYGGNGHLISLNRAYPDIVIGDDDCFKILGRVLGKVEIK